MKAIEVFETGRREVDVLSAQDPLRDDLGGDAALGSAIERAALVLLVSHFEGFLKELVEECVDRLCLANIEIRAVPRSLRELHSLPRLDEILRCGDVTQRSVLLKRLSEIALLWHPSAKLQKAQLSAAVVVRQVTSAAPDVIEAVFEYFGVEQVCSGDIDVKDFESGELAPVSIKTKLTEIVDCRNEIAHGQADKRVTSLDVDRYGAFLVALAKRLSAKADAMLDELTATESEIGLADGEPADKEDLAVESV